MDPHFVISSYNDVIGSNRFLDFFHPMLRELQTHHSQPLAWVVGQMLLYAFRHNAEFEQLIAKSRTKINMPDNSFYVG